MSDHPGMEENNLETEMNGNDTEVEIEQHYVCLKNIKKYKNYKPY